MGRARQIADLIGGTTPDIILKTSDGAILNLQTSDTTVAADGVLGAINFQAPDEASGTDSILIASKIEAVAEGTFSASSNATSLVFSTASSAAAGTVSGKMTFTSGGNLIIKDTDTADGSSPTITLQSGDTDIAASDVLGTINFQAPDEGTGTDAILVAAGIQAVSEGDFSSSSNATSLVFKTGSREAAAEKARIDSSGNVLVGHTAAQTNGGTIAALQIEGTDAEGGSISVFRNGANANGPAIFLGKSRGSSLGDNTVIQSGDELGKILFVAGDGTDRASLAGAISCAIDTTPGANDTPGRLVFSTTGNSSNTISERMRINEQGRVMIGATTFDSANTGVYFSTSKGFFTASGDAPVAINRLSSDGNLVELQQASNTEGTISVSGSTVTYGGFSGQHESSGIATDTPVGTVVSTIDELDVYPSKQYGCEGDLVDCPRAGQTRADHAKVEVSDTVGDSAVYGVVSRFDEFDKVYIASVGIGSVRVTGACAKGDLLESNGDGTAKVQSDDIIRSKTIGKVTIGNSSTDVKLVSCVLYCG